LRGCFRRISGISLDRKWLEYGFDIGPYQGHHPEWENNEPEQTAYAYGIDLWMASALGNISGQFVQLDDADDNHQDGKHD
jgi:hypothetical protein